MNAPKCLRPCVSFANSDNIGFKKEFLRSFLQEKSFNGLINKYSILSLKREETDSRHHMYFIYLQLSLNCYDKNIMFIYNNNKHWELVVIFPHKKQSCTMTRWESFMRRKITSFSDGKQLLTDDFPLGLNRQDPVNRKQRSSSTANYWILIYSCGVYVMKVGRTFIQWQFFIFAMCNRQMNIVIQFS